MNTSTLVAVSLVGTVVLAGASMLWHVDAPPREREGRLLAAVGAVWLAALLTTASEGGQHGVG